MGVLTFHSHKMDTNLGEAAFLASTSHFVAAVGAVVDAVAALGRRQARGRVVGAHDVADLKQKLEITAWSKQTPP